MTNIRWAMITTEEYDPIEEFIGTQLRSISGEVGIIPKKGRTTRVLGLWPYQHHKETRTTKNTHEDQLLDALDKKYRRGKRRQEKIIDLLSQGYRQVEIAPLLGVSYRTIKRDVNKIRGRLKLWIKTQG